jgi:hypothetical protein
MLVHPRHAQIQEHHVGQPDPAHVERLHAVFRFGNLEFHPFQDAARDLANDAGIIDHETGLHRFSPASSLCRPWSGT